MTLKIDLKAIARRAVKKAAGVGTMVELLEMFPEESVQHNKSLEEGTLKVRLPDLGVELRNIIYRVRIKNNNKHVVIVIPSSSHKHKKGKKIHLDNFIFTDPSTWKDVVEKLKSQVLENYQLRQKDPEA